MSKARTGSLTWRKKGWHVRLTVDVDGCAIRKWVDLQTENKQVARIKANRLAKQNVSTTVAALTESAKMLETYAAAARRVRDDRRTAGIKSADGREDSLDARFVLSHIGDRDVRTIRSTDIRGILNEAAETGLAHASLQHIKNCMSVVFDALWRDELIPENPCKRVKTPAGKRDRRERTVLTDIELQIYVAHEFPGKSKASLQRQVMALTSRCFGGIRAGDSASLRWEQLETQGGGFTYGTAPRNKTERPQQLAIPEVLRPFLRDWWERHGRPSSGLVFPKLMGVDAGVGRRVNASQAEAQRRDLQRAFEADRARNPNSLAPAKGSPRWIELFEDTDLSKRVDWHSHRRAFSQALANAGVNAQQAAALTGHASLVSHSKYLANTSTARTMPADALPWQHVESSRPRTIESSSERLDASQALAITSFTHTSHGPYGRADLSQPNAQAVEDTSLYNTSRDSSLVGFPSTCDERTIRAADISTLPATPLVRVLDLVRAVDGALIAGDVHSARRLLASIEKSLVAESSVDVNTKRGAP